MRTLFWIPRTLKGKGNDQLWNKENAKISTPFQWGFEPGCKTIPPLQGTNKLEVFLWEGEGRKVNFILITHREKAIPVKFKIFIHLKKL